MRTAGAGSNRQSRAELLPGAGRLLRQLGNRFSQDSREAIGRIGGVRPRSVRLRSPDEPTGRANARPMTGPAISGAVLELSRMPLTLIRATCYAPHGAG